MIKQNKKIHKNNLENIKWLNKKNWKYKIK